jgi:hypothetical protein
MQAAKLLSICNFSDLAAHFPAILPTFAPPFEGNIAQPAP